MHTQDRPLFFRRVRRALVMQAVASGHDHKTARRMAAAVTDKQLEEATRKAAPPDMTKDGPSETTFWDRLVQFFTDWGPLILKVLSFIVPLMLKTNARSAAAPKVAVADTVKLFVELEDEQYQAERGGRRHAVVSHKLLAKAAGLLDKRDAAFLKEDNPGMASKWHNQCDGVLCVLEDEYRLKAGTLSLKDRLLRLYDKVK